MEQNNQMQTQGNEAVTKWQNSYETCLSQIQVNTVGQVLQSQNPSLAKLRSVIGDQTPMQILVDLINNFLDFLNVGKNMSNNQVLETVRLIMQDYIVLKPDDFVLFFDRAKKGWYGKAYDRMDGSVILEWLELYMQQRNEEIEAIRVNEAKVIQKKLPEEKGIPMPDYVKELKDKINVSKVEKIPSIPIITPLDELIHSLSREFDLLSAEQKTTGLVNFEGVKYDKEGFLKMKLGYGKNP